MVEIDAAGRSACADDLRPARQSPAAGLVEPPAGGRDQGPRDPQAATARVARDGVAAVRQDADSHGVNRMDGASRTACTVREEPLEVRYVLRLRSLLRKVLLRDEHGEAKALEVARSPGLSPR